MRSGIWGCCVGTYSGAELQQRATPSDLLRAGLATNPDGLALVSARTRLTWQALDELSARLASGYLDLGLEAGDRIASLMPNRFELVVHYLACFKAGLVATPLNYRYTAPEIDHALGVSDARMLLAHVERDEDLSASERVAGLPLGRIGFGDRRSATAQRSRNCLPRSTGLDARDSRARAPGGDLLHVGQHGPAEGRDAHARDARLDVRDGGRRTRARLPVTSCLPVPRSRTSGRSTSRSGR